MKKLLSFSAIILLVISSILPTANMVSAEESVKYADGEYDLPLTVLHETEDKESSMGRYLHEPSVVIEDGEATVIVTLTSSDMIAAFQVENAGEFIDTELISENKEENTREVSFKVDDLSAIITGKVSVDTGNPKFGVMHHNVRLQFDPSEIPKQLVKYADGEYDLPFTVLHETKDEESSMGRYVQEPSVVIKDGEATVTVTLTSSSMITAFQVENDNKLIDTDIISENQEENTREVSFKVDDLNAIIAGKVSVDTGNPMFGVMNHDVRLQFDPNKIPLAPEEPKEKPEPDLLNLEDGNYTIDFEALHAEEDKVSGMARYIDKPASLSVTGDKSLLTLTINNDKTVTGFQVENNGELNQEIAKKINKEANTREITFEIDNMASVVNAQVQYTAGGHNGDQPLRLSFEKDSIQVVKPKEETKENPKDKVDPIIDPKRLDDGKYSINFKVLENNTNNTSIMDDYVVSPGVLTVKDGNQFIAITLTSSSWITDFQVESDDKFTIPKELSADSEENTRVVEFEVKDLFKKMNAKVSLDIPEHNYKTTHDVQFAFDTDSIEFLKGGQPPVEKVDKTEPKTKPKNNPAKSDENEEILGFDRDADATSNESVMGKKGSNPKTGDTTKILLFASLLIGSLIPLVIKYRKRILI